MTFSLKVAAQNFGDDPDVLVMIMVVAIIGLVLLMVIGGELGRRGQAEEAGAGQVCQRKNTVDRIHARGMTKWPC
jgi:predicted Na+-dependent transporter